LAGIADAQTPPAQTSAPQTASADAPDVGNVTSVQGTATVTRKGAPKSLVAQDTIYEGDELSTGASSSLAIIFDDETTFNLSANASITVGKFIYEPGGSGNSALFKIARGKVAFAANQVARPAT
jgi:hypothetical protein